MKHTASDFDVVIVGGGMVGATTAALCARAGFRTALLDLKAPPEFDPASEPALRVSALSSGSRAILSEAGIWRQLERQRHGVFRHMHVEDAQGAAAIDFSAAEQGGEALGYIVENHLLVATLWRAMDAAGMVELLAPARINRIEAGTQAMTLHLDGGGRCSSRLLVAADGARSGIRRHLGIAQEVREYNQSAVVATVTTTQVNTETAWQRFLPTGPLAFLPLADGRSSIVWSMPRSEAAAGVELADADFLTRINQATDGWRGGVVATSSRASFPLSLRLSEHYVVGRTVLLGDAAHVVHPLAGQGVNLGLMDAAALVEVLLEGRHRGHALERCLRRFERWRSSENRLMAEGIHYLHELFALPGEPSRVLRRLGLRLAGSSALLRREFFRRASGQHGNAPRLARGESIQNLSRP